MDYIRFKLICFLKRHLGTCLLCGAGEQEEIVYKQVRREYESEAGANNLLAGSAPAHAGQQARALLGSRAAPHAWYGHTEQRRTAGVGTSLEDRFGGGREVPALSSVGSGGRWLAGTEQAYGGQQPAGFKGADANFQ
ncbi:hypothetical protein ROHU_011338 [Labeo rohita]|uniref:Uncharacterized protein n=1 Tax=Labeo rohita TaxID=84645 RepID=A0A498LKA1_LABRO|nr:hypothetical protein ROHU_011338 [Labeo rohita]